MTTVPTMPRKKPTEGNFNPAVPLALPNRELFAQAVASGVPVQAAYERAGFTGNKTTRSHLRHDPQVDARVTWLLTDRIRADTAARHRREKPLADLRARVVRELERVAFADLRNVVQWERRPVVDRGGQRGPLRGCDDPDAVGAFSALTLLQPCAA